MIEVTRSTTISATALWRVLSDIRNWPSWVPTVDALRALEPDRPDEVGASYVLNQPGLPQAEWTITDWQPGKNLTWESHAAGVQSTGRHELVSQEQGTTVRLSIEWTGPLAGLVRLLLGPKTKRYVTQEIEALEHTAGRRSNPA